MHQVGTVMDSIRSPLILFVLLLLTVSSGSSRAGGNQGILWEQHAVESSKCHKLWASRVTLVVSRRAINGSDVLHFWLRNCSTNRIRYSEEYAIDRFGGARWNLVAGGRSEVWRRWLRMVRSGRVGESQSYALDNSLEPGRYRVRKKFSMLDGARAKRMVRIAEFRVRR